MRLLFLLSPFLLLCTASCGDQEISLVDELPPVEKEYPGVEKDFWPYLQLFENESAERGTNIELANSGVTLSYNGKSNHPDGIVGTCQHNPQDPNAIAIDSTIWSNSTRFGQEKIIFHELGHCSLNRGHEDASHPDGTCKSLMRSDPIHCLLVYDANTRQQYLDELFSK